MGRRKIYEDGAARQRACRERRREQVVTARQAGAGESEQEIEQRGKDTRLLLDLIDETEAAKRIHPVTARRLVGRIHKIA